MHVHCAHVFNRRQKLQASVSKAGEKEDMVSTRFMTPFWATETMTAFTQRGKEPRILFDIF